MAKKKYGFHANFIAGTIFGLCVGVFLSTWCRNKFIPCAPSFSRSGCCASRYQANIQGIEADNLIGTSVQAQGQTAGVSNNVIIEEADEKGFLFIGVMTAKKYLDSRAIAGFNTWARSVNGKVVFFSSEGSISSYDIPVVSLKNVDDSYPPQKKSFMTLKYMYDNYVDRYEWFMRADDDVFIKGDKLEKFLRSINSSKPQFIGQAGVGTKEEIGLLSLGQDDNYCMGGPGMVFSHETLRKMGPYLGTCVHNLFTTHEDVEIGRCVKHYAGIPCTWSFEMTKLFYQNFKEYKGSFIKTLNHKDVLHTITMHPVKTPVHQYRINNYFNSRSIIDLRQRELILQREISDMDQVLNEQKSSIIDTKYGLHPSITKYVPKSRKDLLGWDFIAKSISSHKSVNPRKGIPAFTKEAVDSVTNQALEIINKNSRQRGRQIDFKELLYGYTVTDPQNGLNYILDLLLTYRKYKGKVMTVPVRRHAYLHQTFTQTEFIESPMTSPQVSDISKSPHIFHQLRGSHSDLNKLKETIHFVVPLAGKVDVFDRFMKLYEAICLKKKDSVHMHIVLFTKNSSTQEVEQILRIVGHYQRIYGGSMIEVIEADGSFARARALDIGAKQCSPDDLLFFVDVDILFTSDSLYRIRMNTIQGTQMYYPIVFSQYDPDTICSNVSKSKSKSKPQCIIEVDDFSSKMGYWRQFGYGIAAMYRSDLDTVGGYDTSIQGWGKEDVDLFEKIVNSNLTVFRAVDTGMVHAFHSIKCDLKLDPPQFQMCIGSKATCLGSQFQLAQMVMNIPQILQRKIPS